MLKYFLLAAAFVSGLSYKENESQNIFSPKQENKIEDYSAI